MIGSSSQRFQKIKDLQRNPENIRNMSIVAHVDHGKTTLSDSLLSLNNIIHKRSAGKLKYLDSRQDEQQRGITMKSSSISIFYNYPENKQDYLINLIDSPGHIDFSSEVSSALRLTDGALVLVDVVEGVSAQTHTVIRQCYQEKVKTILVLNKIDRLILELLLEPEDAYIHLSKIIEEVNAIVSQLINGDINNKDKKKNSAGEEMQLAFKNPEEEINLDEIQIEQLENQLYFAAEKNNIVFCSALDCWGFTIRDFAKIYAEKWKCKQNILEKFLYGDFYMNPKNKKISLKPQNKNHQPMFVSLILNNIWKIYEKARDQDKEFLTKIIQTQKLEVDKKFFEILEKDFKTCANNILQQWLPIGKAIINQVIEYLPSPKEAQKERLEVISRKLFRYNNDSEGEKNVHFNALRKGIMTCDQSDEAPVVIFVSKMVNIPKENIQEMSQNLQQEGKNQGIRFMGFARIFSGNVKRGQKVYVIQPKKQDQVDIDNQLQNEFLVDDIFVYMAQNIQGVESIPAGNVLAIGGLENYLFKTGTISSLPECPSFTPINLGAKSILKVAIRSVNLNEQAQLINGLKRLNKSDPSVEVYTQSNGDIILATCGQVHLERCVTDLETMMALVKVQISDPIVSFRETVSYCKVKQLNNSVKQLQYNQKKTYDQDENKDEHQITVSQMKIKLLEQDGVQLEKIDIEKDMDEEDFRYFQCKKFVEEEKEANQYYTQKRDQDPKKLDYFNRGKGIANLTRVNILNIIQKQNIASGETPNQKVKITIRTIGFPFQIAEWLEKQSENLRRIFHEKKRKINEIKEFIFQFEKLVNENIPERSFRDMILNNLISFGPSKLGPNMLIFRNIDPEKSIIYQLKQTVKEMEIQNQNIQDNFTMENIQKSEISQEKLLENQNHSKNNLKSTEILNANFKNIQEHYQIKPDELLNLCYQGFDMAVIAGPLCEEMMMGVCFIIEEFIYEDLKEDNNNIQKLQHGPLAGQLISTIKDLCLESFLGANPRLVEGMYKCYCHADQENYPKVHELLSKRRAQVIEEDLAEGSNLFQIIAHLPLIESMNFYSELQVKTSGRVNAQLVFDTWKIWDQDPFFIAKTEDQKEQLGEIKQIHNPAKSMIDNIRKRKGLMTEQQIVGDGDKQRTQSVTR